MLRALLSLTHPNDSVTAGCLSGMTGLTIGATTRILDRVPGELLFRPRFVRIPRLVDSRQQSGRFGRLVDRFSVLIYMLYVRSTQPERQPQT
jgi:hypothetical protein